MAQQGFIARVYTRRPQGNLFIVRLEAGRKADLITRIIGLGSSPDTVVELSSGDGDAPLLCYVSDLCDAREQGSTPVAPDRPISRDTLEFAATAEFAELCEHHRERGVLSAADCEIVRDVIEQAILRSRPSD